MVIFMIYQPEKREREREKTRHSEQMYRNKSWKTTKTQEKEK
jgi:hypothetical protein